MKWLNTHLQVGCLVWEASRQLDQAGRDRLTYETGRALTDPFQACLVLEACRQLAQDRQRTCEVDTAWATAVVSHKRFRAHLDVGRMVREAGRQLDQDTQLDSEPGTA